MADDTTTDSSIDGAIHPGAAARIVDPTSDARRRRLALAGGLALVIGALTLLTIGQTWGAGESGYVVARKIDAPLLWSVVGVLGALVLWSVRKARRGRTALDVLGWVLVPIVILSALRFGLASNAQDGTQRHPSPDGSRTLVIEPVSSILDPEWEVRVETGHGLTTRYRVLDCVNGDWSNVERAQWLSPTTAKIVHRSGESASDEIATMVTFSGSADGRTDMPGRGFDSCTTGAGSSPR